MRNQVQLITYVDRLTGGNLQDLISLLEGPLRGLFGGCHLLPFSDPIDGADAGFDPVDHTRVDARLGDWEDVYRMSRNTKVMADLIVNHVSAQSPAFRDYLRAGAQSRFAGMFLTMDRVFPAGATERDLLAIYRPRPGLPFTTISRKDGQKELFWTTFTANQMDIDVSHPSGKAYLDAILDQFRQGGVSMIRLDAVGYAIKKPGTSCFMIPETFDFIAALTRQANAMGMEVLVEIHSYYRKQIEIAAKVDYVYDFALPPLVLHALFNHTGRYLKAWMDVRPNNAITVLDTHDGIGVIDIGPDGSDKNQAGLVPDEDIDRLVEQIHVNSGGGSRLATGAAASNLDLYQVNCTYYDALGQEDSDYLLARAIQFFTPGIPQVYYTGFLAEPNDLELLSQTGVGRDINRHYFAQGEAEQALSVPVVQRLMDLIRIRNLCPAFEGTFSMKQIRDEQWEMHWAHPDADATLKIDFRMLTWSIEVDGHLTFMGKES